MAFNKKNYLFFFLLIWNISISQNKGGLSIFMDYESGYKLLEHKTVEYALFKNDSCYKRYFNEGAETQWLIDSIDEGEYILIIKADSVPFATFNHIIVQKKIINNYNFDFNSFKYKFPSDTMKAPARSELTINILYGNNNFYESKKINKNHITSGEIGMNIYFPFKFYSPGIKFGVQYAYTYFNNDTASYIGQQSVNKHYASTVLNLGLINHFTFFNNKYQNTDGLKIDIGVIYNFPLVFKQVRLFDSDTKISTNHIHTYNDFSAILRIGYKYFGIQAEYSLNSFLKNAYIEPPVLKAGIVFFIPTIN
ncbi:MAG: hypothetical protein V4580_05855 [Bacteroidota bacterium]